MIAKVMSELEATAMRMLLAGDLPLLALLRNQLDVVTVEEREFTGAGFFTSFRVPDDAPTPAGVERLVIGDVYADFRGLEHGAGFLLFLKEGKLNVLECFMNGEPYPENPTLERIYYMHPRHPGHPNLIETNERDYRWAIQGKGFRLS